MAIMNFRVNFHGHGFNPEKDIPKEMLERAQAEFIAMHDMFAEMSNKVLDKINGTWDRYEHIKKLDDLLNNDHLATKATLNMMGLNEGDDYNDWVEKWYNEIVKGVDQAAEFSDFILGATSSGMETYPCSA